MKIKGNVRIKFDLRTTNVAYHALGRIYKNGIAYGTERDTLSVNYVTYSEDLEFEINDLIQLYIKNIDASGGAYAQNFRIYGSPYGQFIVNQ